ncbi:hypothetical protein [Streptomyces lavendofoliae]|uniref:hypothetical protein n=1 Tax=Streptomyces lavendofoliae TaxID=67314 RepID=UPI003D8E3F67
MARSSSAVSSETGPHAPYGRSQKSPAPSNSLSSAVSPAGTGGFEHSSRGPSYLLTSLT